jgi:hypothetical protein
MKKYVLFKSIKKIPKRDDALAYMFNSTFRTRDFCGFGHIYNDGKIGAANFVWSKWVDNPIVPDYAHTTNIWIVFSPFNKRYTKYSKIIQQKAKENGYKHIAIIQMGDANNYSFPSPAIIDHRAFHRLVYLYAKKTGGVICDSKNYELCEPDKYFTKYKKFINWPFNLKLSARDLKRFKVC